MPNGSIADAIRAARADVRRNQIDAERLAATTPLTEKVLSLPAEAVAAGASTVAGLGELASVPVVSPWLGQVRDDAQAALQELQRARGATAEGPLMTAVGDVAQSAPTTVAAMAPSLLTRGRLGANTMAGIFGVSTIPDAVDQAAAAGMGPGGQALNAARAAGTAFVASRFLPGATEQVALPGTMGAWMRRPLTRLPAAGLAEGGQEFAEEAGNIVGESAMGLSPGLASDAALERMGRAAAAGGLMGPGVAAPGMAVDAADPVLARIQLARRLATAPGVAPALPEVPTIPADVSAPLVPPTLPDPGTDVPEVRRAWFQALASADPTGTNVSPVAAGPRLWGEPAPDVAPQTAPSIDQTAPQATNRPALTQEDIDNLLSEMHNLTSPIDQTASQTTNLLDRLGRPVIPAADGPRVSPDTGSAPAPVAAGPARPEAPPVPNVPVPSPGTAATGVPAAVPTPPPVPPAAPADQGAVTTGGTVRFVKGKRTGETATVASVRPDGRLVLRLATGKLLGETNGITPDNVAPVESRPSDTTPVVANETRVDQTQMEAAPYNPAAAVEPWGRKWIYRDRAGDESAVYATRQEALDAARAYAAQPVEPATPLDIPSNIREAQIAQDNFTASSVPSFGDMVETPTGEVGFMRGGKLGSDRVTVKGTDGSFLGHFSKNELKLIRRQNVERLPTPEADEIMRQVREEGKQRAAPVTAPTESRPDMATVNLPLDKRGAGSLDRQIDAAMAAIKKEKKEQGRRFAAATRDRRALMKAARQRILDIPLGDSHVLRLADKMNMSPQNVQKSLLKEAGIDPEKVTRWLDERDAAQPTSPTAPAEPAQPMTFPRPSVGSRVVFRKDGFPTKAGVVKGYGDGVGGDNIAYIVFDTEKKKTPIHVRWLSPEQPMEPATPVAAPPAAAAPPAPDAVRPAPEQPPQSRGDAKKAAVLRKMADKAQADGDAIVGRDRLTNTPKRQREAASAMIDGRKLQRAADLIRDYANAVEAGTLPDVLQDKKLTKQDFLMAASKRLNSTGYYSIFETDEWNDTGKVSSALRSLADTPERQQARAAAQRADNLKRKEEAIRFTKIPGFFPTPPSLADSVVDKADIQPGMRVLEPEGGKGDLAERIQAAGGTVDVAETNASLREILTAKGFNLVADDMMTMTGATYDRIVMNPPFEQGQDREHVRHAYTLLKPGGRLVAIMSTGPFNRSMKADVAFRAWADSVGAVVEQNDAKAFAGKDAFRQTGVATVTVTIDKPERPEAQRGPEPQTTPAPRATGEPQPSQRPDAERGTGTPADRAVPGDTTAIEVAGAPSIAARYEVRELGSLIASHQFYGGLPAPDPRYPSGLQPRDYRPGGDESIKVGEQAAGLKPSLLITDAAEATSGPSTITANGVVINGNSRVMTLQAATPEKMAAYRDLLIKKAKNFGIDPNAISAMTTPVLVRVVDMDPTSAAAQEFARRGNVSLTQTQSPSRMAASMGGMISDDVVQQIQTEDQTFSEAINGPAGNAFRRDLIAAIPLQSRTALVDDTTGGFTDAGKDFVRDMLLTKIVTIDTIERLGEVRKGLKRTLEGAIIPLLKARNANASRPLFQAMTEAIQWLAAHPSVTTTKNVPLLVDERGNQIQADFVNATSDRMSPEARTVVDFILREQSAPRRFAAAIAEASAAMSAREGSFLADQEPDPNTAVASALNVTLAPGATFERPASPEVFQLGTGQAVADSMDSVAQLLGGNASVTRDPNGRGFVIHGAGGARVPVRVATTAELDDAKRRSGYGRAAENIQAWWSPRQKSILLVPGVTNGQTRMSHELVHAMQQLGLITAREFSTLLAAAQRRRANGDPLMTDIWNQETERIRTAADDRKAVYARIRDEEMVAYLVEQEAAKGIPTGIGARIRAFFDRIMAVFSTAARERVALRSLMQGSPLTRIPNDATVTSEDKAFALEKPIYQQATRMLPGESTQEAAERRRKEIEAAKNETRPIRKPMGDTIDVDGVQRPTKNSNGQRIAASEEGVRNFWRWFGDSKVVDEQGRPLVVYHGTRRQFERFSPQFAEGYGEGVYLASDPRGIADFAAGEGGRTLELYAKIENPNDGFPPDGADPERFDNSPAYRAEAIRAAGHDGVIADSTEYGMEIVAFSPTQIKSATGNRGTFASDDPSILASLASTYDERAASKRGITTGKPKNLRFFAGMTRLFHYLNPTTDGAWINALNNYVKGREAGPELARNMVQRVVGKLRRESYQLMGDILAIEDIIKEVEAGTYHDTPIPFTDEMAESPDQRTARPLSARDTESRLAALRDTLQNKRDAAPPEVIEAMATHKRLNRGLTGRMVDLGMLRPEVLEDDRYWHRQVWDYLTADNELHSLAVGKQREARLTKRGFQRGRTGGGEFNLDYAQAFHEYWSQALSDIAAKTQLNYLMSLADTRPALEQEARTQNERAWIGDAALAELAELRAERDAIRQQEPLDSDAKKRVAALTERIWELDKRMPYRSQMAQAFDRLGTVADQITAPGFDVDAIFSPESWASDDFDVEDSSINLTHPQAWPLLAWLAEQKPGTSEAMDTAIFAARSVFSARMGMQAAMKADLGRGFRTWRTVAKELPGYVVHQIDKGLQMAKGSVADTATIRQALTDAITVAQKDLAEAQEQADAAPGVTKYRDMVVTMRERLNALEDANRNLDQPGEDSIADMAVPGVSIQVDRLRDQTIVVGRKPEYVIPERLAQQLDDMPGDTEHPVMRMINAPLQLWKLNTLFGPVRALIYTIKNGVGDTISSLEIDPGGLKYIPEALHDVRAFANSATMSPAKQADMERWVANGMIQSGNLREIPDITDLPEMRQLTGQTMLDLIQGRRYGKVLARAATSWFRAIQNINAIREGTSRVALGRHALDLIRAGHRPLWASRREEMQGLYAQLRETTDDAERTRLQYEAAAKLANDALVDYQLTPRYGVFVARNLVPFWRWMFGNPARYANLIRNEITTGGAAAGMRAAGATTAGLAFRSLIMMAGVQAGVAVWNAAIKEAFDISDEEDPNNRQPSKSHILLGKYDGIVRSVGIEIAMSDVLSWIGGQNPVQDVRDIAEGRGGDVVRDNALAPVNKLVSAVRPELQLAFSMLSGMQLWPDITKPRPVKDQGEVMANVLGVAPIYRAMIGTPRGSSAAAEAWNWVGNSFDPGEADFYDIKHRVYQWRDQMGKQDAGRRGETIFEWINRDQRGARTIALARAKAARYNGNLEGAKHWEEVYFRQGGTREGLKASQRSMDPLAPIPERADAASMAARTTRNDFIQSLTPRERAMLARAQAWATRVRQAKD